MISKSLVPLLVLILAVSCAIASAAPPPGKAVGIGLYSGEWDSSNHFYPFVMYDGATYKMYYTGSSRHQSNESAWEQRMIGLAVSNDASSWSIAEDRKLPVLEPHRYIQGDVINPDDAAAVFDSIYATGPCVIKDGSIYKMWYTGWGGTVEHIGGGIENKINYRIGYATSKDGIKWTKHKGPVLDLGTREKADAKGVGQPCVLKEGKTYRMWYEGFDGSAWRIFYATSENGIKWMKQGMIPHIIGRNPVVVKRNEQYELWYQGQSVLPPRFHILRAVSLDGLNWTKATGEVELHPDSHYFGDISVDGIVVLPDNSCQVFFTIDSMSAAGAPIRYSICTEVVNP